VTSERQTGALSPRFPTLLPFTSPWVSSNWLTPLPPPATPSSGRWVGCELVHTLTYMRVYIGYPFLRSPKGLCRSLLNVDRPVRMVLHDLGSPLVLVVRSISALSLHLLFPLLSLCLISLFVLPPRSHGLRPGESTTFLIGHFPGGG